MAITQEGLPVTAFTTTEVSPIFQTSVSVSAGSNRLMVVAYMGRNFVSNPVATITFDGQSFTSGVAISGNTMEAEVWYLVNPNITTANVIVTLASSGNFVASAMVITKWEGVAQSLLVDDTDSVTNASSSSTQLDALTTTTDACLIIDAFASNSGGCTMTAETNRSEKKNFGASDSFGAACSAILTKSPAGSCLMNWTTGAVNVSLAGIAFKPAGAAGATILMGDQLN